MNPCEFLSVLMLWIRTNAIQVFCALSELIHQKVAYCVCACLAFILIYVYDEHIGHQSESNVHREKVLKSITSKIDHLIESLQSRLSVDDLKMLKNKTFN